MAREVAKGLFITGELRSITAQRIRPESGEPFVQTHAVLDVGAPDYLPKVTFRKDDLESIEALRAHQGAIVTLRVSVGNFRKLYFDGFVSAE